VEIFEYAAGIQRRAETQFRRDWTFGFTLWNYLFRTMVNTQHNAFMYCVPDENNQRRPLTGKEILDGLKEIQQKLVKGQYHDMSNQVRPINGDLSKVRFAGVGPAAEKAHSLAEHLLSRLLQILANTEARSRNIPGTHEVRNTMRHQTHANRICHGTPLFVTFPPSERDNTLMLRLARARQNDPSLSEETETNRAAQGRSKPELDVEFYSLSPEALAAELPPYDDRRAMLTKDPLACADGFRTLVQLALRHLFGVRYCPRCPDCGNAKEACMDAFGSNAMACGGIFGRVDAVYGSIECQKSGVLHIHFQVFVECFHQFKSLSELQTLDSERKVALFQKYCAYTAHASRTIYENPEEWEQKRDETEKQWPEYRHSTTALSRPSYQSANDSVDGQTWRKLYLHEDVEVLQQLKQHHVHNPPTQPGGPRTPLDHCRSKEDPTKCKAGFPRDQQLIDTTA
ncbi:unnamed protein product, partial [Symbiodinium sp. CCMP2456]